jgi:3-phenylpropionate/trans-cinnamate dioxygenase ferredoxin subunit
VATDLGPVEEFVDGRFRLLHVRGREVGVLRRGDEVKVIRNICPHAVGPVCKGFVAQPLTASDGEVVFNEESGPVLVCPWHRWEYRLSDGRCLHHPRFHLQMWPAFVENGRVMAELPASQRKK